HVGCSSGATPGSNIPEIEGQCVVAQDFVALESLVEATYRAADGSSLTTYAYWRLTCNGATRSCDGSVTVLGDEGGIAAGERTSVNGALLESVRGNLARIQWGEARLAVDVDEELVYYLGSDRALVAGEGQGRCKRSSLRRISPEESA
ncbi:hypothetical protein, partial [Haliangium sp.]|uniref:hypothetical protein n=1 Tax=Haliangium sp. TaxID=2663208 RepID=UPI003D0B5D87